MPFMFKPSMHAWQVLMDFVQELKNKTRTQTYSKSKACEKYDRDRDQWIMEI